MTKIQECSLAWVLCVLTDRRQSIAVRSFLVFLSKQKNISYLCLSSRKVPLNPEVNKLRILKKEFEATSGGLGSQPALALKPRTTWNPT